MDPIEMAMTRSVVERVLKFKNFQSITARVKSS